MSTPHTSIVPLDPAAFGRALASGHGRALRHVRTFGIGEYGGALLDACRRTLVYDYQCEGGRAEWLLEMTDAAGLTSELADLLCADALLPDDEFRYWDLWQRCELLRELALRGDARARTALYDMCRPASESANVFACDDIIAMDGRKGLVFVAQRLGRLLVEDTRLWYDGRVLDVFDELYGVGAGLEVLSPLAAVDADIARYLREVEERRRAWEQQCPEPSERATVGDVMREIGSDPPQPLYWLMKWGRTMTADEAEVLLDALAAETDVRRIHELLRCFRRVGFPRFDPRLRRLLTCDDSDIESHVLSALAKLRDPDVHALAREYLRAGRLTEGLTLLESQSDEEDLVLVRAMFEVPDDPDDFHYLGLLLLNVLETTSGDIRDLATLMYDRTPCTSCRELAVEAMLKRSVMSESIRLECRFDGNPDIRRLVGAS